MQLAISARGFAPTGSKALDVRWAVPAIFALAIALRILLILLLPQAPFSDAEFYVTTAREIAAGRGYNDAGIVTAFWPVGYPAMLAATMRVFGDSLAGPLLLNLAATGVVLASLLWFGRNMGSERAGRIAALLYALYPAHIAYAGVPMSETSYTAIVMPAFALLIAGRRDWRRLALAGLLFGLATLMRPQTMLFPVGAIVALLFVYRDFRLRDAVKAALILHLALAAAVLPWSARNYRHFDSFVLVSTNGGVSLYGGAHEGATGDHFAGPWEQGPLWRATGIPHAERIERQAELDGRFRALAFGWIKENPGRWAKLGLRKIALLWIKDSDGFWFLKNSHPQLERELTAVQWLDQIFYLALLALALPCFTAGIRSLWRGDAERRPLLLLACMPAFVTLLAFVFSGQVRYHYPAMPFVILAAAWTLAQLRPPRGHADGDKAALPH